MDSANLAEHEHQHPNSKYIRTPTMPFGKQRPQRNLTTKEQAARDLCIIMNSIMKRKFLKTLERIQYYNFDSIRKGVANDNIQLGYRLADEQLGKRKKKRTRSLDPYVEYSRSRLLHEIVSKLKAKNQGHSWEQDNTTVLYEKVRDLQRLIQKQKNGSNLDESNNISNYGHHNASSEELKAAIQKIKKDIQLQQRDQAVEDTSNITHAQSSANSSLYRDLFQFTHQGAYNSKKNSHQYDYSSSRNPPNYERVRAFVSPDSAYRNQQLKSSSNYVKNSFGNDEPGYSKYQNTNNNCNENNSNKNNLLRQQQKPLQSHGEISARDNGTTTKQKIKVISELTSKNKLSQASKQEKRTYNIVSPSLESQTSPKAKTIPAIASKNKETNLPLCGFCDRCY